ncbi:hypothetical protein B0H14DRAFT_2596533 [Mycena olivaceomarginata]|nr:hypothetical protein B0H14DRAFT_2596533 [Mycena olivaceomarginata]
MPVTLIEGFVVNGTPEEVDVVGVAELEVLRVASGALRTMGAARRDRWRIKICELSGAKLQMVQEDQLAGYDETETAFIHLTGEETVLQLYRPETRYRLIHDISLTSTTFNHASRGHLTALVSMRYVRMRRLDGLESWAVSCGLYHLSTSVKHGSGALPSRHTLEIDASEAWSSSEQGSGDARMKQGLSFLASTFIFLKILRVRTSWVDSERVTERLEYRQEPNELSPSYILLVSRLLQLCSEVKHDLPLTSVHHRTICYFDTSREREETAAGYVIAV